MTAGDGGDEQEIERLLVADDDALQLGPCEVAQLLERVRRDRGHRRRAY